MNGINRSNTGCRLQRRAWRRLHSRPDVTLRTYSHILPGQDQAAAEAIDAVL
jgi:hypothetical protein